MWYEQLSSGKRWSSLWHGYIRCGCGGIQRNDQACPVCAAPLPSGTMTVVREEDGTEYQVALAYMGGERSYEDYVYLQMLEREWKRPITDADRFLDIAASHRPSARAIVVLVFWTYFETRIERLIRDATRALPEAVVKDLLGRYTSVSSRMDRLYKVLFGGSYAGDLRALGYAKIADLLQRVQAQRNEFAHGHPEAIGDPLVEEVVAALKDEHESWIVLFNAKIKQARVGDRASGS